VPNIVLFAIRSLGWGDIGVGEDRRVSTPNLQRIKSEGLCFDRFYLDHTKEDWNFHTLLTGKVRIADRQGSSGDPSDFEASDLPVSKLLKTAGYKTGFIGFWPGGGEGRPGHPVRQGFDEFVGQLDPFEAEKPYPGWIRRNESKLMIFENRSQNRVNRYVEEILKDAAWNFIRINQPQSYAMDRRFFLCYSPFAPSVSQTRWQAEGNGMFCPDLHQFAEKDWPTPEKYKAAMLQDLDYRIGSLMERIAKMEVPGNTAVIVVGLSGAHSEGGTSAEFLSSNGVLRGQRGTLNEGGLRVPAMVWWPARVESGISNVPVSLKNVASTIAALAGQGNLSRAPSLLAGTDALREQAPLVWQLQGDAPVKAVVSGNWKLISHGKPGRVELYELDSDPGEQNDLSASYPEVAERLKDDLVLAGAED